MTATLFLFLSMPFHCQRLIDPRQHSIQHQIKHMLTAWQQDPLDSSIQLKWIIRNKARPGTTCSAEVYMIWNAFCSDSKVFLKLGLHFCQCSTQAQRNEGRPNSHSHSHSHWLLSKGFCEHIISGLQVERSFRFLASKRLYLTHGKCKHSPQACIQDTTISATGHSIWQIDCISG